MYATRSLLTLTPFLGLDWQPGARHHCVVPHTSSLLTHLIAKGCAPREILTDTKTFLIGIDGHFQPITTAESVDDLKRAALRQHLIDCLDTPPMVCEKLCSMVIIKDRQALISQLSALEGKPIDYTITVYQLLSALRAKKRTPQIIH